MKRGQANSKLLESLYLKSPSVTQLPDVLRAWMGIAAIVAGATLVLCVLISCGLVVRLGWDALTGPTPIYQEAAKNFIFAFASGFGAPFLVWRAWTAHRQANAASEQVRVALENHITGIFSKSVELMGSVRDTTSLGPDKLTITSSVPNIEARLGALYSLERLLLESEKDQRTILETMCAYVRENSPLEIPDDESAASAFFRGELPPAATRRADVQAAITIIGRRPEIIRTRAIAQKWRLDFRNTNLITYDFSNLNFDSADFDNSFLNGARLAGTSFDWCSFKHAFCKGADLTGTSFQHSTFDDCDFAKSTISNTDFRWAKLIGTDLRTATVTSFDVRGANLDAAFSSMLDYMLKRAKEKDITPYEAIEFSSISQLFKKSTFDEGTSVSQTVHDILAIMAPKA